jgi:hypothetical protein
VEEVADDLGLDLRGGDAVTPLALALSNDDSRLADDVAVGEPSKVLPLLAQVEPEHFDVVISSSLLSKKRLYIHPFSRLHCIALAPQALIDLLQSCGARVLIDHDEGSGE